MNGYACECGGRKAFYARECRACRNKHPAVSHGLSYDPVYRVWQTMRLRCTVPTNSAYAAYGGRGITVCARWLGDAAAFVADMGPKPTPKHEIDRKDNNGGYWCGKCGECGECAALGRPANCRWATRRENDRNRRNNRMMTLDGVTLTQVEWAERVGLPITTVSKRVQLGWSDERALRTPKSNVGPKPKTRSAA